MVPEAMFSNLNGSRWDNFSRSEMYQLGLVFYAGQMEGMIDDKDDLVIEFDREYKSRKISYLDREQE